MGKSIQMPPNTQDTLAGLRQRRLVQDNSGPFRVYRDSKGTIYHSVTHILKETSDTTGLDNWIKRLGPQEASQQRDVAANRGNMAHSQAEYLLKTSQRLARSTANKRNAIHWDDQGLARIPPKITQWALEKVYPGVPKVGFSASGYARGLSNWIASNVTEIFASEFSIHHPAGFAGTCDALVSLKGHSGLIVADWKTSVGRKEICPGHSYFDQLGAYALGLEHMTALRASGAAVILARRCGEPDVFVFGPSELALAKDGYLRRVEQYFKTRATPPT
jgi:hypothetical protein